MTAPLQNGEARSSSSRSFPAVTHATGGAVTASNAECARDRAQLSDLPGTAPALLDAPISGVGGFFGGAA
jgi:hypothetical protein